jgi:hypothetical protein
MPTFKNIRIPKKGGGFRLQRVQVLKSGKFKFVKNKKGGSSTSKKSTKTKKKSGGKKKKSNPKKGSGNVSKKNNMSFGNIFMGDAFLGPAIKPGIQFASGGRDARGMIRALSRSYTGFNPDTRSFEAGDLVNGYGGVVNEILVRKISRATGVQAFPSKKSPVEMALFFGKDILNAFENQGDLEAFYTQHYKDYHGVDLDASGFDAYNPFEMVDTHGVLWMYKQGKKFIRQNTGYKLPSFM